MSQPRLIGQGGELSLAQKAVKKFPPLKIIWRQNFSDQDDSLRVEQYYPTSTMVTKSKLKMALVAEKGVDFKKANQKKQQKAARKEKSKKAVNGEPKKAEEDWEDIDSAKDDGGLEVDEEEGESGSDEEVEAPMQVW